MPNLPGAATAWFETWNRLDREAFFALLAPDFVAKGVMGPGGVDKETLWKLVVAFRETFPDQRWELGAWLACDGDIVVCEVVETGTFTGPWANPEQGTPPTNRSYVSHAAMFFRFDTDGLIVENESWYDSVDWFHQIGVDPNIAAPPGAEPDASAVARRRAWPVQQA